MDLAPSPHGLIDTPSSSFRSEMPSLRMATNGQQQLQVRQPREQSRSPDFRALPPGRQVAAVGPQAGEAESHGKDRELRRIVEFAFFNLQPSPQPYSRWVIERAAAVMNSGSGSLAGDADTSCLRDLNDRSRLVDQRLPIARSIAADPAVADRAHKRIERLVFADRERGSLSCLHAHVTRPTVEQQDRRPSRRIERRLRGSGRPAPGGPPA